MSQVQARVEVAVRLRPLASTGRDRTAVAACVDADEQSGTVTVLREGRHKQFTFDHVFGQSTSNADIYAAIGRPLLSAALDGYNATLFAYGQTGAGKTHTVMGSRGDAGLVLRLVRELFDDVAQRGQSIQFSMLEIYNEQIRDLFSISSRQLRLREAPGKGAFVEGLSWYAAKSAAEMEQLVSAGAQARTIRSTHNNQQSSRAHTVIQIAVFAADGETSIAGGCSGATGRATKICLVDLAGSERNDPVGHRVPSGAFKEGTHINQSLSCLGLCINALVAVNNGRQTATTRRLHALGVSPGRSDGRSRRAISPALASGAAHVPYRNSTLTWLLRESIGGNSKTAIVAAVNPDGRQRDQTIATLRFADRAKQLRTNVDRAGCDVRIGALMLDARKTADAG